MTKLVIFLDKIYLFDFFYVTNKLVWLIYTAGFLLLFMFSDSINFRIDMQISPTTFKLTKLCISCVLSLRIIARVLHQHDWRNFDPQQWKICPPISILKTGQSCACSVCQWDKLIVSKLVEVNFTCIQINF